uniref:Uncharacterized protein n=1 Tax=Aegilops tauschii subsp. strangulata TaxID=200361 RepID=A0A453RN34_AEGTS
PSPRDQSTRAAAQATRGPGQYNLTPRSLSLSPFQSRRTAAGKGRANQPIPPPHSTPRRSKSELVPAFHCRPRR